jgi:hypothetical protein
MRSSMLVKVLSGAAVVSTVLLVVFLAERMQSTKPPRIEPAAIAPDEPELAATTIKTNVVVRRQFFTWQELESNDYPTYIANLRAIGCPELTIRDIIVADVNQLYARKKAVEILTPDHQWWRSEPDLDLTQAALDQLQFLEAERKELLARLLGPDWDITAPPPSRFVYLTGPVLGNLPAETKQAVQAIAARGQRAREEYLAAQRAAGEPANPAELARIHRQTRQDLAGVLTGEQLEEYLLRYSPVAETMRQEFASFGIDSNEFRSIFRLREPLEDQLQVLDGDDLINRKRRQTLESQREAALQQYLGLERYRMFKLSQDAEFRAAQTAAERVQAPAEAVIPLYEINRASELERQRIRADGALTAEEKAAALRTVQAQQEETLRVILGPAAYERYRESP